MSDEHSKPKCSRHGNELMDGPCGRCGGDGYTEFDIDEMDNPLAWHDDGSCWQCKGTGVWKKSFCIDCEHETEVDE